MRFPSALTSRIATPILAVVVSTLGAASAQAITITYEAPNQHAANASVGPTHQINFESLTTGSHNGYFENFVDAGTGNDYRASYDALQIYNYPGGTQTAGAGYQGNFAANFSDYDVQTTNLSFTNQDNGGIPAGVRYFGMFYSSLDSANELSLYNGNTLLAQFTIGNIPQILNNEPGFVGGPYTQEGVFFNFYADGNEQITRVQFSQVGGGGFEHDNHTFRVPDALARTGTNVNPSGLNITGGSSGINGVPGPAFIASQVLLGLVTAAKRRKKQAVA